MPLGARRSSIVRQNGSVYLPWVCLQGFACHGTGDRGQGEGGYATAQGKDTPTDGILNDATEILIEFDSDLHDAHAKPTNDPICQCGEDNDTIESDVLFPYRPIERVVQVFGGLWNKNDICIRFIFKTVGFYIVREVVIGLEDIYHRREGRFLLSRRDR